MKGFFKGFAFAWAGVIAAIRTGRNLRFMLAFALLALAVFAPIIKMVSEWCIIAALIGLTLAAEMFNSSIERLCDKVTLKRDSDIKFVKDTAAGAVLTLCFFDAIIGCVMLFSGGRFLKLLEFCRQNPAYIAVLAVIVIIGCLITPKKRKKNGE